MWELRVATRAVGDLPFHIQSIERVIEIRKLVLRIHMYDASSVIVVKKAVTPAYVHLWIAS
jgi:hypothetical protein